MKQSETIIVTRQDKSTKQKYQILYHYMKLILFFKNFIAFLENILSKVLVPTRFIDLNVLFFSGFQIIRAYIR